ncbi:MAG: IS110 family transposase [Desulfobacterales bacterium]|nr:IS110 family transposase [Desulfobacterales bacterium]
MNCDHVSRIERFRQFKRGVRGSVRHLIVGIDIAKDKHHAFLGDANGKTVLRRLIITNDKEGFERLIAHVRQYMTRDGFDEAVFGVEPTSVYHKPLAEFLIDRGYLVVYVTNDAIKKNRSLIDGRWDKNDTKDSANVADLISQGKCHFYDLPQQGLRDVRNLLLLRKRLKKQEHGQRIRIRNNLVAQYFPELDRFWNKSEAENLAIVRWCLSPIKIRDLEFDAFVRMVTSKNRGLKQRNRLRGVWETAAHSVGCHLGTSAELEAEILVDDLEKIRARINQIERRIHEICLGFEHYQLLMTIPGFGPYISALALASIGDPNRFENASQVIRLAGLDLNAVRSGKKSQSAVAVISKRGKSDLRYGLYQAGLIASSKNTRFMTYFENLLRGREKEKGIRTKMRVKLSAKMLVIAWTMMKKAQEFNPDLLKIEYPVGGR